MFKNYKKREEILKKEIERLRERCDEYFQKWQEERVKIFGEHKEIETLKEELDRYKKLYLLQLEQSIRLSEKLEGRKANEEKTV
jgi:peptidoglycan hydrolase CwlO-like protein